MLPNSASGNGITNQGVREVQSPGAGFAVVLHGAQAVKEAVMKTNKASCVSVVFLHQIGLPVLLKCITIKDNMV